MTEKLKAELREAYSHNSEQAKVLKETKERND
jgi:hypothetical protein